MSPSLIRPFFELVIVLYSFYKSYGNDCNFYEFPFIVLTVSFIPLSFIFLLNSLSFYLILLNLSFITGSSKSSFLKLFNYAFFYSIYFISLSKLDKFLISYNLFISFNYLSNYSYTDLPLYNSSLDKFIFYYY